MAYYKNEVEQEIPMLKGLDKKNARVMIHELFWSLVDRSALV